MNIENTKESAMSIGNNIYKLRTAKNLSQGELADILDVSRQSVSKWETDAAIPDLDKLIKLFDLFEVSLDEITDRAENVKKSKPKTKSGPTQKVIGYILFAVSLLLGILTLFLSYNESDFLILLPLAFAIMGCGLLCLFKGRTAFYWCIWTIFAPIIILSPRLVGFPVVSSATTITVLLMVIMFFVARATFKDVVIKKSNKRTILLSLAWVLPLGWLFLRICILTLPLPPNFHFHNTFSVLGNLICYTLIVLAETYTVCYLNRK